MDTQASACSLVCTAVDCDGSVVLLQAAPQTCGVRHTVSFTLPLLQEADKKAKAAKKRERETKKKEQSAKKAKKAETPKVSCGVHVA